MMGDERGYWPPYVGELWDAAARGSYETVGHVSQISMAKVWAMAVGRRGRWPFDASEHVVFTIDVVIVGYSANESTSGTRSHRFHLNKRECVTIPYLARQLLVFRKLN
jgi:hypothetical protein